MAISISNQATLQYTTGDHIVTVSSNVATISQQDLLEIRKYALESTYIIGENLTYMIFVTNNGREALSDLIIQDNLGTYAAFDSFNVTPLTYLEPATLFMDQVLTGPIVGYLSPDLDLLTFHVDRLDPEATLMILYRCLVNEYALGSPGSIVKSIVSVGSAEYPIRSIVPLILPVDSYTNVIIQKTTTPNPFCDGTPMTYIFTIYNYGNISVKKSSISDQFFPAPIISSVTLNGLLTTDYDYITGRFQYPGALSSISYDIPAATFMQNKDTGVVTILPGESTLIIQGLLPEDHLDLA